MFLHGSPYLSFKFLLGFMLDPIVVILSWWPNMRRKQFDSTIFHFEKWVSAVESHTGTTKDLYNCSLTLRSREDRPLIYGLIALVSLYALHFILSTCSLNRSFLSSITLIYLTESDS